MDIAAYLKRIGYNGPTTADAETLRALHRAHMLAVPFENLDIGWKQPIELDIDRFVHKIVQQRRGGFCYELNGAFGALLAAVGFQVRTLSARVAAADGTFSPEFDHMALHVELGEPWLADVGFGDSFLEPLAIQPELEQSDGMRTYKIVRDLGEPERFQVQRTEAEGRWKPEYSFTMRSFALKDFAGMCRFHQTSPESHFTRKRVCSRATVDGRVTLTDDRLIITRHGIREEKIVSSPEEWAETLREQFGIQAPAG
jgi:N-hydroxyarylamine O-acetyltransferase